MNNKRAMSQLGLTITIAVLFFMAGMIFLNPLKDSVSDTRTALGCSTPDSISEGTKLTCIAVDIIIPYLIILIISLAVGAVIARFVI